MGRIWSLFVNTLESFFHLGSVFVDLWITLTHEFMLSLTFNKIMNHLTL